MLCLHDSRRDDDPSVQRLLHAVADAYSLTVFILAAWQVARRLTVRLVAAVLAERAHRPCAWPRGPVCGVSLRSKGCATRQLTSLFGPLRWRRRVGRCPQGCAIPPVAPCDEALGVPPSQRSSGALQSLGCACAVLVPCATAARLLGWDRGSTVSARAVWCWGPAAGHQPMEPLQEDLAAVAQDHGPRPEPLTAEPVALPLALGAAGVRVPLRPEAGAPTGNTRWREITVGVLARLSQQHTRTGQVVTRLVQRRLVAVVGDSAALTPRLWLAALRQGSKSAPPVGWLSDGGRGVWRLFEERCAGHARGLVDFSPAAQQRWKGAAAWLDGRTTQAHRWCGGARHRLRHGMPDGVLADLVEA
jgi:hypothetical protein